MRLDTYPSSVVPTSTPGPKIQEILKSEHCHAGLKIPNNKSAERTLIVVTVLCMLFMIGEFIGGYFAKSLAIMTDAAHMLTDFASFLISLFAIYIARRPATTRLSFGYYRAEVIGALVSILAIWVLTGVLVYLAVHRTIKQEFDIDATTMLITAACGVAFNIIMALVLFKSGHGHSHGGGGGHGHSHFGGGHGHGHAHPGRAGASGHSHTGSSGDSSPDSPDSNSLECPPPYARRTTSISVSAYPLEQLSQIQKPKDKNINVRAAFIHVLGDLIQSVGILIGALIIKFKPEYKLADPICTFIFSLLVLVTTITVMRDILRVLMEATPTDVNYTELKEDLMSIEGVLAVHNLHIWSLTMDKGALAVHLAIGKSNQTAAMSVMSSASKLIRAKYNIMYTTIQVEPFLEDIMPSCDHCKGPTQ